MFWDLTESDHNSVHVFLILQSPEIATIVSSFGECVLACILYIDVGRDSSVSRSQWPSGLSRRSAASRLLGLWVRIPPGAWIFVVCVTQSGQSRRRNK